MKLKCYIKSKDDRECEIISPLSVNLSPQKIVQYIYSNIFMLDMSVAFDHKKTLSWVCLQNSFCIDTIPGMTKKQSREIYVKKVKSEIDGCKTDGQIHLSFRKERDKPLLLTNMVTAYTHKYEYKHLPEITEFVNNKFVTYIEEDMVDSLYLPQYRQLHKMLTHTNNKSLCKIEGSYLYLNKALITYLESLGIPSKTIIKIISRIAKGLTRFSFGFTNTLTGERMSRTFTIY